MNTIKQEDTPARRRYTIQTVYYLRDKVVRTNHAAHANNAVQNCVGHMQLNRYAAMRAEVFDSASGVLHAVITRSIVGHIGIVFKREVKEHYNGG